MIRRFWRIFFNFEKEEKWLSDMAKKGLHLQDRFWCIYTFRQGKPKDYIYHIEFVDFLIWGMEIYEYTDFLDKHKIQFVTNTNHYIYVRKKGNKEIVSIYDDVNKEIKYYRKSIRLWLIFIGLEFLMGLSNIGIWCVNGDYGGMVPNINLIGGIILILIGVMLLKIYLPVLDRLIKLDRGKDKIT